MLFFLLIHFVLIPLLIECFEKYLDGSRKFSIKPFIAGFVSEVRLHGRLRHKPRQSGCRLMATKVRGVKATLVLASCSGAATPVTLHHIFVQLRKMSPKERQSITRPLLHCVAAGITDRPCVKKTGRLRWRRPANFTAVCCYVRIHYLYSNGIVDDLTGTSIALVTA